MPAIVTPIRTFRWYDEPPLTPRQRDARQRLALMRAIEKTSPIAYAAWVLSDKDDGVLADALADLQAAAR